MVSKLYMRPYTSIHIHDKNPPIRHIHLFGWIRRPVNLLSEHELTVFFKGCFSSRVVSRLWLVFSLGSSCLLVHVRPAIGFVGRMAGLRSGKNPSWSTVCSVMTLAKET